MEIQIRKAKEKDLKDIQKLNGDMCKEEHDRYDDTIIVDYPFTKEGERYFKDKLSGNKNCSLVALNGKKVVGYLVGGIFEIEDYRKASIIAEAENMAVSEECRGRGIGTKLLQEFLKWCRDKKVERVKVVISAGNEKSINFHKKNGFKDSNITLEREMF